MGPASSAEKPAENQVRLVLSKERKNVLYVVYFWLPCDKLLQTWNVNMYKK